MMEKLSLAGEGCRVHAHPPHYIYHHPTKLQCTLQLRGQLPGTLPPYFISTPYVLCGLHDNQPGLGDVSGEVGPDLLRPARLAADGRQLICHLCGAASASRSLHIRKKQVNNMMTGVRIRESCIFWGNNFFRSALVSMRIRVLQFISMLIRALTSYSKQKFHVSTVHFFKFHLFYLITCLR